jgi:hypothetical protein
MFSFRDSTCSFTCFYTFLIYTFDKGIFKLKKMKNNYNYSLRFCNKQSIEFTILLAFMLFSNILLYAQTPCLSPTNISIQSLTTEGATITWSSPNPAPWNGYEYFRTTIPGYTPTPSTGGTDVTGNSVTISNLQSNSTNFVFLRSRCGTITGNTTSQWIGPTVFTTLGPGSGCAIAPFGLYPVTAFTPLYTGSQEIINADAYAGEYCKVNVLANREFVFSTSVATDYITITNQSLNTILAHGPSPLTWNSNGYNGEIRYYISTNSSCGTQEINRTRSIIGRLPASNCGSPNSILMSSIQANQINLSWTDSSPGVFGNFQYYYSTSNATPSINAVPNGVTNLDYTTVSNLTANTTYYFWLRKQCDVNLSQWTFGGTFTTLSSNPTGCFVAIYGQYPPDIFVPNCNGNPEVITPIGRAGEFSVVSILPNRTYTFSSSEATDYITIQDDISDFIYASGLTPLVWSSGANTTEVKYYFHTSSNCGFNISSRTRSISCAPTFVCTSPTSLAANSITTSGANLTWNAASPIPSNGYQYYVSTTNAAPSSGTTPTGNASGTSALLLGLNSNTTYYFWVRSNCGSSQSNWSAQSSFTTLDVVVVVCNPPSNVSIFNITSNTASITWSQAITTPSNGYQYYYSTSNTNPTNATTPSGSTPSTGTNLSGLNSSTTYYFWVRSSCEALNSAWISGGSFSTLVSTCNPPSSLVATAITSNSAQIDWLPASPAPSNYDVYLATSNTAPNASTTPTGSIPGTSGILNSLSASTTYYFWVRSNCGATKSAWIAGSNFTTSNGTGACTDAPYGLFPSTAFTPNCTGTVQTIVNNAYAGEYSLVNVLANTQYTFASSVASDYITITNEAGTVLNANGTTPLVWQSAAAGVIRYYFHTDSSCGSEEVDRTRFITCSSGTPSCTPPTNLFVNEITPLTVRLNWTPSFLPIGNFDYLVRQNNVTPTAASIPSNTVSSVSEFMLPPNAQPNTTYYWWVRSNCGSTKSAWAVGGSFITASVTSCNQATFGLYPDDTFVGSCNNTSELIDAFNAASQYSNVSVQSNKQYTFTSSIATDFITIANAANTAVLASGVTPLNWQSGSYSGTIRFFSHKNASCGTDNEFRSKFVRCSTTLSTVINNIESLQVFPNPTISNLHIKHEQKISKVEITNTLGQKILEQHTDSNESIIDMSSFTAGIYIVKVHVDNLNKTIKIIKK